MPLMNAAQITTESGFDHICPFSPDANWQGDENAYVELIRDRFHKDLQHGQRLRFIAHFAIGNAVVVKGPFAKAAGAIINKLKRQCTFRTKHQELTTEGLNVQN